MQVFRALQALTLLSLGAAQLWSGFSISSPNSFGVRLLEQGGSGAITTNVARESTTTIFATDSLAGAPIHNYLNIADGL